MTNQNLGWICPRCNNCYSPTVQQCTSCNSFVIEPWPIIPYIPPVVEYPSCTCGFGITIVPCPIHGNANWAHIETGTEGPKRHEFVSQPPGGYESGVLAQPVLVEKHFDITAQGVKNIEEVWKDPDCSCADGLCQKHHKEDKGLYFEEMKDKAKKKCDCVGLGPCSAKECEYRDSKHPWYEATDSFDNHVCTEEGGCKDGDCGWKFRGYDG